MRPTRTMLALLVASTLVGAMGCGAGATAQAAGPATPMTVAENTNAPPPTAFTPTPPADAAPSPPGARAGTGSSQEDPIQACGPDDSYRYVAQQFRCPDGSNPLGGDPSAGRDARVGNVGANSTGHIIDLYRVPCASGAVDVYVDMYGCPEMDPTGGGG